MIFTNLRPIREIAFDRKSDLANNFYPAHLGYGLSLYALDDNCHRTRIRCAAYYKHLPRLKRSPSALFARVGMNCPIKFDILAFEIRAHCRFLCSVNQIHGLGFDVTCFVPWQIGPAGILRHGGLLRIDRR
jgi:hypothetical protein